MREWYVAGVMANKENLALRHLEHQGFQAFCPRFVKWVSHARTRRAKHASLFPGYLFVRLDLDTDRWRSVDGTIGITRLVRFGLRPARFHKDFAEHLWRNADESGLISFEEELAVGDRVRAIGGAFDSQIGELIQMNDASRVVALMSMLGRKVPVTLNRGDVMKVA